MLNLLPMTLELNKKQASFLRSLAHALEPSLKLGKQGASENFQNELRRCLAEHELVARVDPVNNSPKVDVQGAVPVVQRVVPGLARDGDAGVVEQVIEPAVLLCRGLDQLCHRRRVGDVDGLTVLAGWSDCRSQVRRLRGGGRPRRSGGFTRSSDTNRCSISR